MSDTSTGITGTYYIDALLEGLSYRWNASSPVGTAVTVTFSFMEAAPSNADSSDANGFTALTSEQRAAARLAFTQIQSVSGISFVEATDSSAVNVRLGSNAQGGVSAGYAYLPYSTSDGRGGQVYLATESSGDGTTAGTYGYATILHEIGHAIGLKHPGNYNAGDTSGSAGTPPFLPASEDNVGNSLMSYNDHVSGLSASTLMPYDIAALQYLYGANTTTGAGASTYSFTDVAALQTVYDTSGTDVFDFQALSQGVTVNLAAGTHSSVGLATSGVAAASNLAIAYDTVIENAVGSNYADSIQGNASANTLTGGAGNDTLLGLDGADVLYGGLGNDVIYGGTGGDTIYAGQNDDDIYGGQGDDRIESGLGGDTIASGLGNDTLLAGQGDDLLLAGQGDDNLQGGLGNDTLAGGLGADTLMGNGGDDSLTGMAGLDWLDGGLGNDTLIGGDDADVYQLAGLNGDDRIEGFITGSDQARVSSLNAYTLTDTASGAQLQFSAGGSVLFVGVLSSDVSSSILVV